MKDKGLATLVLLFIWSSVLAGPLKFISLTTGVPVHLVCKLLLFCGVVNHFVLVRATVKQVVIALAIAILAYVGHVHRLPLFQVAFGLWALLPFFVGLLFPDVILSEYLRRRLLLIFAVSVAGEFLSYFVVFPWAGMALEVGGVATSGVREWSAGSARRLAGFTSSSVDLSVVLATLGIMIMFQSKRFLTRAAILPIVGATIYATTMKTAMAAFVVACLPLLASGRFLRVFTGVIALVSMIFGIAIPFSLKTDFMGTIEFVRAHHFETLLARIDVTWPHVLGYLQHAGTGIWGIGLGGLGSAAALTFDFAFVDDFYLILIGTGGLLGCLVLFFFARRIIGGAFGAIDGQTRVQLPLLAFFAIYGVSQPLIEAAVGALFLGASISAAARRRQSVVRRSRLAVYPQSPGIALEALPQ